MWRISVTPKNITSSRTEKARGGKTTTPAALGGRRDSRGRKPITNNTNRSVTGKAVQDFLNQPSSPTIPTYARNNS